MTLRMHSQTLVCMHQCKCILVVGVLESIKCIPSRRVCVYVCLYFCLGSFSLSLASTGSRVEGFLFKLLINFDSAGVLDLGSNDTDEEE